MVWQDTRSGLVICLAVRLDCPLIQVIKKLMEILKQHNFLLILLDIDSDKKSSHALSVCLRKGAILRRGWSCA